MKIFTSYFGASRKIDAAVYAPISIARFNRFWSGPKYPPLAPTADMVHLREQDYLPLYNAILARLDPAKVADDLAALARGLAPVMLCYERPGGDFCHRHMAARWLERALGIEVPELQIGSARPSHSIAQSALIF